MDSVPNFEDILILGPVSSTCRVVSLYCECVHPSRHLAEHAVSIATVIGGLIANACHSCSLSSAILSTVLAGTCLFVAQCVHSFCIQGSNRIACSTF